MKIREIVSKIQAQEPLSRELLKEIHAILESKADDAYKLLSAMSLATCAPFDEKTRTLTASLLQCHADPILAGRALKVLIVAWGGYANYRSELINGIFGENWDNGHYRLAAIQSSGAYLRRIPRQRNIICNIEVSFGSRRAGRYTRGFSRRHFKSYGQKHARDRQ